MTVPPNTVRTFQRGLDAAEKAEPRIKFLEAVAAAAPEFRDRVQELRDMSDHCRLLCGACLAACRPTAGSE